MTMVIYRLVGEHGQLRRSTIGHLDSLGETLLMCARCVGAYHWQVPAQLPSPSGTDACPEEGIRASRTKMFTWSSFLQSHKLCGLDGIRCRRSTERDQPMWMEKKNTFVLGFQAQQDFVLSCAFYSAIQVFKSSARQQLKKSPSSLIFHGTFFLSPDVRFPPSSSRSPQDLHPDIV